ncbi:MAG: hypothetical protein P1S60_11615 [Anaerolineae bacterium]|nr:hypothetical protein [Anaerolineae bacterium]
MGNMTRIQKIIVIVLAVLDLIIIGGLAGVIIISTQNLVRPTAVIMVTASKSAVIQPTWTPTLTPTAAPTLPPRHTNTPTPTPTLLPTYTPSPTATPSPPEPVPLQGAEFDFLLPNRIPGWKWYAFVNYRSGDEYDPNSSFAEPVFSAADDPLRQISGTTLKVETVRWLKFRTWVHQSITVTAGSSVSFRIKAKAFSSLDSLIVKAGIDPQGADNCNGVRWGQEMHINQDSGVVTLTAPRIIVPITEQEDEDAPAAQLSRITVCFYAEPKHPHVNNAAFFDQAELIVTPPR